MDRERRPFFALLALLAFGCAAPEEGGANEDSAESAMAAGQRYRVTLVSASGRRGDLESIPELYATGTFGPLQFQTPPVKGECYRAFGSEHCYVEARYAHWNAEIGVIDEAALATAQITARVYDEDPLKWDDLMGSCERAPGKIWDPSVLEAGCTGKVERLTFRLWPVE